ncbi:hypothetical protein [Arthrobacter sp. fls2-241-R2A-200]|uniref:hypothetical protein n=1 Tax=Arthrobacter sp. fls2-241-R2A-200 TaxID=3040281 RepID=UPI00254FCDE7|nr:hypothetical protein [Arthrobacter sp. fls2-241-R2A-200]
MTQLSPDPNDSQPTGPDTTAGTPHSTAGSGQKYDAVVGPFTVRDVTVFGSALLMFVASLLPMFAGVYNLWNVGNLFFLLLGIILPLVVVALFVARRLRPNVHLRIGSLSIDQFASVTASFAVPLFFLTIANSYNTGVLVGLVGSVGLLVATVLAPHLPLLSTDFKGRVEVPAHLVAREAATPSRKPVSPRPPKAPKTPKPAAAPAATVVSPSAPVSSAPASSAPAAAVVSGTAGGGASPTSPAPSVTSGASPAAKASGSGQAAPPQPVVPQPVVPQPVVPQPTVPQAPGERPWAATMATPIVSGSTAAVADSIGATVDPANRPDESAPAAYEAFWFAVAQPRTAYDERSGAPAFTIDPGGWVLALEDRGHEFLVQDTDGKVGVLRELSNIERG